MEPIHSRDVTRLDHKTNPPLASNDLPGCGYRNVCNYLSPAYSNSMESMLAGGDAMSSAMVLFVAGWTVHRSAAISGLLQSRKVCSADPLVSATLGLLIVGWVHFLWKWLSQGARRANG